MLSINLTQRENALYYGGQWHQPTGSDIIHAVNPAEGKIFRSVASASDEQVFSAIGEATQAWKTWRLKSGEERAQYLRHIALGLENRRDMLAELQMLNNGKPRQEAEIDVSDAVATFEYYADLAENLSGKQGEVVELDDHQFAGQTRYESIGPVGLIVPWNFPLVTSAWKIAPALAAGCTVVMKTSEITPLTELVYGDIAEECGLPDGVLNILVGSSSVGISLVQDKRLRKISFTGSNNVGANIMRSLASRTLPLSLELGGKSPILVLDDADLDLAVDCVVSGIFYNCGQMCSATSRLIVDTSIADALIEGVVQKAKNLRIGAPLESDEIDMGPLTSRAQYDQTISYQRQAKADGLQCLMGGEDPVYDNGGFFATPTIYNNVPLDHPVWREEIFGPILAIRDFNSEQAALDLCNDSDFGLVATILSSDNEKADYFSSRIEAGHIWINTPQVIFPNTAWGGCKGSGIGRELGPWGLSAFLSVKHITSNCNY